MNKKQAKNREGAERRAQSKIPPSWELSDEQWAFIEDLWQDADSEQARPHRPAALADHAAAAGQCAEQHLQDGQAQQGDQRQAPAFRQIVQQAE